MKLNINCCCGSAQSLLGSKVVRCVWTSYPQESSLSGTGSWRRTRSAECGAGGRTCCGDTWSRLSPSSGPWTHRERPWTQSWVAGCSFRLQVKSPLWSLVALQRSFVQVAVETASVWDTVSPAATKSVQLSVQHVSDGVQVIVRDLFHGASLRTCCQIYTSPARHPH